MIEKDDIQKYALKLMFKMSDEELDTLQDEFKIILKQMDLINEIEGIEKIEPMFYPFITYEADLREDVCNDSLSIDEVLFNTNHQLNDQVKVPKVVE